MAIIYPDGWKELEATGSLAREIETLSFLADTLSDEFRIYHGVHWTRVQQNYQLIGEIDFAILSPSGKLLLIEQKSGFLTETSDGLVKTYNNKTKPVAFQMNRTIDGMRLRLDQYCKGTKVNIESMLYCPDFTVKDPGSAGIDPARIVDSTRREHLATIIRSALPLDQPAHPITGQLHAFLSDTLNLVPNANAFVGQAKTLYTRLSGGLAEWARKVECKPFRLRIIGTAGSGKTQLALAVFRDAVAAGKRPLYICYNRPLADHFIQISPLGGHIATYHQLCDKVYRSQGLIPDFTKSDTYGLLESYMTAFQPGEEWLFDELIIDEGQDFQTEWKDNLLKLLRPNSKAWWLEDPMQKLYRRPDVELTDWVTLRSNTNYRTPRDILDNLSQLIPLTAPIEAGSPLTGSDVDILTYTETSGLIEQTKRAITQCIALGYKRDMIAVVTFRGRENSALSSYDKLGPFSLKKFTGGYDLLGNPVFTEGDILVESVYRFKGQAAPCVILTEIDFEEMDEITIRKLFVGSTRATMKLVMVMSENTTKAIMSNQNNQQLKLEGSNCRTESQDMRRLNEVSCFVAAA